MKLLLVFIISISSLVGLGSTAFSATGERTTELQEVMKEMK